MRRVLSGVGVALFVAARAATAQGFTIDWSHTTVTGGQLLPGQGPDRAAALELRADNPGGTRFQLVTIDRPPTGGGPYVVRGMVRYDGVEGQGYLEMWSVFPDGGRYFTRTLAPQGSLAALRGESNWRPFAGHRNTKSPRDRSGAARAGQRGDRAAPTGPLFTSGWDDRRCLVERAHRAVVRCPAGQLARRPGRDHRRSGGTRYGASVRAELGDGADPGGRRVRPGWDRRRVCRPAAVRVVPGAVAGRVVGDSRHRAVATAAAAVCGR